MELNSSAIQPFVSVIIPNYNHQAFLEARIKSVLTQSLYNLECVILDDASTDHSAALIHKFVQNNNRLNYYPSTSNSGSTFIQWNKGVKLANADLVWIAESDDNASPAFLEELVKPFKTDPDIVLAYCQSYRMNDKDEVTGSWKDYTDDFDNGLFQNDYVMDGKQYIERFLIHRNTIPNASAVVFRKDIYEKAGSAPEHLKTNGDWLTWLKMLCYGKIAFIAKPMNYFRYHGASVIAKANQEKNSGQYREQFDYTLRIEFKQFLKHEQVKLSTNTSRTNNYFIALDSGNEGLFKLRHGQILKGWKKILLASVFPTLQSGFIKKGISGK